MFLNIATYFPRDFFRKSVGANTQQGFPSRAERGMFYLQRVLLSKLLMLKECVESKLESDWENFLRPLRPRKGWGRMEVRVPKLNLNINLER